MEDQTLHTTRIGLPIAPDDVTEKPSLSEHTCKYGGAHPPTGMTRVAQLGERRTSNPKVVGSNPTSGRSFRTSTVHSVVIDPDEYLRVNY